MAVVCQPYAPAAALLPRNITFMLLVLISVNVLVQIANKMGLPKELYCVQAVTETAVGNGGED
jgi:hypothetical protein